MTSLHSMIADLLNTLSTLFLKISYSFDLQFWNLALSDNNKNELSTMFIDLICVLVDFRKGVSFRLHICIDFSSNFPSFEAAHKYNGSFSNSSNIYLQEKQGNILDVFSIRNSCSNQV